MTKTFSFVFFLLFSVSVFAGAYDDAWEAIRGKDFQRAKTLLLRATKDPATATDAYYSLLYLNTYQGSETEIPGLADQVLKTPGKDAYVFASWFNGSILGQYSKKKAYQLALLNKIIDDASFNGSLRAAAHYVKGMHYLLSHDYADWRQEDVRTGSIQDWQLTGPFENLSGSGFNVNHGPLQNATAAARFAGADNVEVSWFTPLRTNREGWIFTYPHLPKNTAIVYAQSFVNAAEDMSVLLNAGCSGALKVWVNDGLVLSAPKERVTEMDYYKNVVQLKKGFNRILVELAYTDNSMPNFIVRLTDPQFNAVEGLSGSASYHAYPKGADAASTQSQKHFAEAFFEKKIETQPSNLVNYILLSQAYLRDQRITEARLVIEKALRLSPENPLLKFELIQCLIKADNRTLLLQEVDWVKQKDPESFINYQLQIQNLVKEEKYQEALDQLAKMEHLYDEDESSLATRASILAKMEKIDDLLKLIDKGYKAFPENTDFVSMQFRVQKLMVKDNKAALKVYEKYLKSNYNYNLLTGLADEYKDQGLNEKYLGVLNELYEQFGSDPRFVNSLSKYYFEKGDYRKSLEYAKESLLLAPFTGSNWKNVANILEVMGEKSEAVAAYRKAIYYDRTDYDSRKKLNTLEGKEDLYKLLPDEDVYSLIQQTPVDKAHDYNYLLDQKGVIIYDEGASEEYVTYAVKINTQKGIDAWKEIYLSYSSSQSLMVEKVEVVKSNGSKVTAEREDDHVVFTGLEPGDGIYVKYRLQNYSSGRLGRAFYDRFLFSSFAPSRLARYTLIAPKDFRFESKLLNSPAKPVVQPHGDVKIYSWEFRDLPELKSEPLMPPLGDVAIVLHISTIKEWQEVAEWYSDLSYQDLTDNIELDNTYSEIFPANKPMSNLEKARRIHDYIITNIRYSSVSFRQSGLVPQSVSKTISTRLGDCKDLSSLFVALAKKAGISAQLVLIDTRDNGSRDMVLPTMDFNHCIARANIDGKDYYIELTDDHLPFGSLTYDLNGSLSLVVPPHGQKAVSGLQPLNAVNRTPDRSLRTVNVGVDGKDIHLDVVSKRYGALVSGWRQDYGTLPAEKQKEQFEQSLGNGSKNPVKLEAVSFRGLEDLSDSLITNYTYTIKNEVAEAGSMKMLKVPFIDLVATLENVSSEERKFPIEYWNYENTDAYETTVDITIPAGMQYIEVPKDQSFSFKSSTYSLRYVKDGRHLKVTRKAQLSRDNIAPADYVAFRKFFNDIVEAESRYLVFK